MKLFKALVAAGMLIALSTAAYAASAAGDHVVATVGDHRITQQEVDKRLKPQLTAMEGQLYELRRRMIESMADDFLIAEAAKKANLTVDAYLKREIDSKVKAPTDAELKSFYDQHKAQINQPFDKIKEPLISFMKRQQTEQRRDELLTSLRAGHPVKIMLQAPRFNVKSAGHPALGSANAPITIVEFGDFQCPFCKRVEDTLKQVRTKYGDKVRLVYLDFPLSIHAHAMDAAEAARCAEEQGKFWPFHDALFADQSKLAPADLKATAAKLGLDKAKFDSCLDGHKYQAAIRADMSQGESLGVDGTPAFFLNGRMLSGAQPLGRFQEIIDDELSSKGKLASARQ